MEPASNGEWAKLNPPPPLTRHEALVEANRCLMCWDAPCTKACPTSIDVPGFIKRIATGDDVGSARTILEANILGSACARVCPTEVLCEGACVLHDLHARPIEIGRLQAYATDPIVLDGIPLFAAGPPTGRQVAIIGGGPAGLSCAAELVQLGHAAVVFDAAPEPGGLNTYGVAEYKLQQDTSLLEIQWLRDLGVEIRSGVTVGADVTIEALLGDYDALFVGIGLGDIPPLELPGEELDGVESALAFIERLKTHPHAEASLAAERVAVIGGGNTAVDAVIQSARLGADKVTLVYRRGREHMRAYDHEIAKAQADGVEFEFWAMPVAVTGSGSVEGLECIRTALDSDGRPQPVAGSEFRLDVTRVFRATGQAKQRDFLSGIPQLEIDAGGRVVVDDNFRTAHPAVWAGGDCVNGGKEVVNAVAHGKAAAQAIDVELTGAATTSTGR